LLLLLLPWQAILAADELRLEKVSLQLDWIYQFEFAGFIAARERGFYRDAGLDVELIEYRPGLYTVQEVMSGRVNYGIHNSSLVIEEGRIVPIVLLATYLQRSPLIFVTSPDINNPSDLIGKRIMGTTDELKYSSLALLLDHFYINDRNTSLVEHDFSIDSFVGGRVDAMSAFRSNQLHELDRLGVEYNILDPADYGFYMSAVNLFTTRQEALLHPQRTQRFVAATNRGWAYALGHMDEIVDLIIERYSSVKSREALLAEAKVIRTMMLLDFYSIGATNEELSSRAFKQLQQSKLLGPEEELGSFIFEDVLRTQGQTIVWTPEERRFLHHKGEIRMCVDPDWMPFEAIRDGRHVGIAADLFSLFQKLLPVPVRLVQTSSWAASLDHIKSGKCDILSLAAATPTRSRYLDFTQSYIDLPVVMATRTDKYFIDRIERVKERKIGVVEGYAIAEFLRSSVADINLVDVASITEGLRRVESGELYGYVDNLMTIASSIQKEFTGVLKISARLDEQVQLAVATRKQEPLLHAIFELVVERINRDEKQKQAIYNKWVSVRQEMGFDYRLFWKVGIVMTVILLMFAFYAYKLRKYNRMLEWLSTTDALTGVHNRMKMDRVVMQQYNSYLRYRTPFSVILVDIDLFKQVNDTYGHQTGDAVLKEFAGLLRRHVRVTDFVGRWGGEEFLVVCPHIKVTEAERVAAKLLERIRDHSFGHGERLTASIGVAAIAADLSIEGLLKIADDALYRSKQRGRDCLTVATPGDRPAGPRALAI